MNKKEFIEKLKGHGAWCTECHDINGEKDRYVKVAKVRELLEQLDEPQKVKAKQFVADWFEEHKHNLSNSLWEFTAELNEKTLVTGAIYTEFESWFIEHPRAYEFITSMGKGYEVEEPKWVVKYKPGNLENNWYFIGFCGGDRTLQPNCASHIDCDTVIKFKDRSKAEAVATLIDGLIEKVEA